MTRSYRYRINPSRLQAVVLLRWLSLTRELYNAALQERRDAWRKQGKSISLYDQQQQLPAVRATRPEFNSVPVWVSRGALARVDRAFTAFFRRCKSGGKPGYPRFKGRGHFESILIDDLEGKSPIVAGGKRVHVPLLGKVKFKQHRPIQGTPKAMRIKLEKDGHWYVTFACADVPEKPLPATGKSAGVDLGLLTFAATSNGEMFENPRPMRAARIAVERAQRRVSRRVKRSRRRRKAVRLLAKKHLHVANVRREHHIAVARTLVEKYDTIYVEALNIKGLASGMLAKSVNDAAWGEFLHWLRVKAESAGRVVVEVNPCGTSQVCSGCGVIGEHKSLAVRVHRCPDCGLVLDRDINAAKNILAAGKAAQGEARAVRRPRRSANLTSPQRPGHASPRGADSQKDVGK